MVFAFSYTQANTIQESNSIDGSSDISGYTITNIGYTLLSSDPAKVKRITLDVDFSDGIDEAVDARISVNNSATWIACTYLAVHKLVCVFPASSEPSIASISNIRLITKNPVPWYMKTLFSILNILNQNK